MRSIRAKLLLGTTIGAAASFAAGGVFLFLLVRAGLVRQLDDSLADNARLYASTVEPRKKRPGVEVDKLDMREFEVAERPAYLELWFDDGSVIFRSPSLRGGDLELFRGSLDDPVYQWITLPDGRPGRAVGMEFVPKDKKPKENEPTPAAGTEPLIVSLVLARDATAVVEGITRFGVLLAAVGLLTVAVTACFLRVVILSGLKPLRRLADQIGGIGAADLSRRIGLDVEPSELQPVRARLNDLLSRLEEAFRRERTLSANLAHELRTPIAGLRTTMEVAVSKPRLPREYEEAFDECLEITRQVQGMVEKLLSLFRLEAGPCPIGTDEVALDEFVKGSWEAMARGSADAKRLQVRWSLCAARLLVTDRDLLGLAVRNILENAAAYTGDGGWIAVETRFNNGAARLRVANSGCTLRPEEAERVFDRFWRGDSVRSDAGVHCGLGLSLVRKVLEVLGGSADVRTVNGGEFEITVSIPARERAEAAKLAAR